MNKKELQALETLKGYSLEEIGAELAKVNKQSYGIEKNANYYFVSFGGGISDEPYVTDAIDNAQINTTPCFKTQEEAQEYLEYCQAYMRVINAIRELNDGWTPDFSDGSTYKFCVYYDYYSLKLTGSSDIQCSGSNHLLYLRTEELTRQLIKERGTDLELILRYNNFNWVRLN